jgi:putative spermidine/putrescine transport system permease protein
MTEARLRGWRRGPWLLVAPLLLFLLILFVAPVLLMLARGVTEHEVPNAWPRTAAALLAWNGEGLPTDAVAATAAAEMAASHRAGTVSSTSARLAGGAPGTSIADLARIDSRWGDRGTWTALRHASGSPTSFYLWAALDARVDADGRVVAVPAEQAVFVEILLRTFKISAVVTLLCLLLGYPLAYFLARLSERWANPLLILVLLPFWTSTLVRTAAWVVLLQTNGVVNATLQGTGLADAPLELLYNRAGVYIAMTHVLLPFLVLPLYGVMRGVPEGAMRAAGSLGANPWIAFLRVYFPQTLPGVAAGAVIVFTLSLGYYITPALVGGGADQMLSASIAFYTSESLNWGMAAALSILLVVPVAIMLLLGRMRFRLAGVA